MADVVFRQNRNGFLTNKTEAFDQTSVKKNLAVLY